jgi:hypothetical protein
MDFERAVRRLRRSALMLALGLSIAVSTSSAFAQPSASDKESARALMTQGDKAYDAKDYPSALSAYQGAHALMHVPGTGIWVAKSELALGHLVEAREAAIEVTRMPAPASEPAAFAKARAEADELARSLAARIPSLQIKVEGARVGAKITVKLDGNELSSSVASLPRKVNPGKHVAIASAPGQRDAAAEASVSEGETATLSLRFGAEDASAPAPFAPTVQSTTPDVAKRGISPLVPIGFTVGAVGLGVGAVFGIISLGKTSDVKNAPCVTKGIACSADVHSQYSSANTTGWVSNIGLVVGAVGIGVGVIGLFSGRKAPTNTGTSVEVRVGAGNATLEGTF